MKQITAPSLGFLDTRYLKLDASNDPITGDLLIQPTSNSTTTLVVNQSDTTNVLTVDTTNARVGIGTATPSNLLHIDANFANSVSTAITNPGIIFTDSGSGAGYTSGIIPSVNGRDIDFRALAVRFFATVTTQGTEWRAYDSNNAYYAGLSNDGTVTRIRSAKDGGVSALPIVFSFLESSTNYEMMRILRNGNVGIGVTDPDTMLEVFGATGLKISFDATDNTTLVTDTTGLLTITASGAGVRLPTTSQLQFNDTSTYLAYSGGDLDLYTAANKTLELQTVVYNDIYIPLAGAKVPSSNAPTWAAFDTNLNSYTFALNDYTDLATAEILHDYKEGTDIVIHVHFVTNGANDGTERKVKYQVFYSWGDAGEAMTAEATDSAEQTIVASEADRTHHNLSITTVTGTNYKIGSILKIRLKRIAGTGTEPASDPFVEMVGIHYSVNSLGSRQITTK